MQSSQAVFRTDENKTAARAAVKVEDQQHKFVNTVVLTKEVNGQEHIENIELGGTRLKLVFN